MIKKAATILLPVILLLTSCVNKAQRSSVMPFEATLHKYIYTLSKDLTEIDLSETNILSENENFAIVYKDGTLAFTDKKSNVYYDTFGNAYEEMPSSGLNISVTQKEKKVLYYKNGQYYNTETDSYENTFTAYKLTDNSVRILIVTGLDEFDIIGKTPLVLTEETISENAELKSFYSNEQSVKESVMEKYPLLNERLCLTDDRLYYIETDITENSFKNLGLTKNTTRETALKLGYKYSDVKVMLTTIDITLLEDKIILDISKNRQYRTEILRDKSFTASIFDFDIQFIEKTVSESDKITDAQSKY